MWQRLKGLPSAGAIILGLALVQATGAATTPAPTVYTVESRPVPGVDTGLVLRKGQPVIVTATGTVCPRTGLCTTPDGDPTVDTKTMAFGGFLQPQAPAYGLVARVGSGQWVHVGSGPEKLSGKGALVFAFNDDHYRDNVGTFEVTVAYSRGSAPQEALQCRPGWGYGDTNHDHAGPPSRAEDPCYPGNGYGDKNHEHDGPPGQDKGPSERGNKPER